MRKYVMNESKNGYSKEVQTVYKYRIKKYTVQALNDLTLLAKNLPEDQQDEIFSAGNLNPLLRVLFKHKFRQDLTEEALEKRRVRLLELCYDYISQTGDLSNAVSLAPEIWNVLKYAEGTPIQSIRGLTAIYIASLNRGKKT